MSVKKAQTSSAVILAAFVQRPPRRLLLRVPGRRLPAGAGRARRRCSIPVMQLIASIGHLMLPAQVTGYVSTRRGFSLLASKCGVGNGLDGVEAADGKGERI